MVHRRREDGIDEALQEWLHKTQQPMSELRGLLQQHHDNRGTSAILHTIQPWYAPFMHAVLRAEMHVPELHVLET